MVWTATFQSESPKKEIERKTWRRGDLNGSWFQSESPKKEIERSEKHFLMHQEDLVSIRISEKGDWKKLLLALLVALEIRFNQNLRKRRLKVEYLTILSKKVIMFQSESPKKEIERSSFCTSVGIISASFNQNLRKRRLKVTWLFTWHISRTSLFQSESPKKEIESYGFSDGV